jgi:peptidoglycan/xylan/chitin deacetylase (PgdA/CDA1 family)
MTAPRWPHGKRAACAFTFDLDAETLWPARGVNEPVTVSQGPFGVLEALPRILDLLRQAEMPASFFVPAWVAEHHPDAVHEKVGDLDAAQDAPVFMLTGQRALQPPGPVLQGWLIGGP